MVYLRPRPEGKVYKLHVYTNFENEASFCHPLSKMRRVLMQFLHQLLSSTTHKEIKYLKTQISLHTAHTENHSISLKKSDVKVCVAMLGWSRCYNNERDKKPASLK